MTILETLTKQIEVHVARGAPVGPMEINPFELKTMLDSLATLKKELWVRRGDSKLDEIAMKLNSCLNGRYTESSYL